MAYVSVPKDLTKVKNKLVFNLTRRQIICFSIAAAIGLPFYFLTRDALGTTTSATCMVLLMLPAFLFAMYERDGLPLEKVLMNLIATKFLRPGVRKYEMTNLYEKKKAVPAMGAARKGARNVPKKKKRRARRNV